MNLRVTIYDFMWVVGILMVVLLAMAVGTAPTVHAMPEYATRVGEPCATCHVSPAGGGLRNLRGQAWVLSGKPSTVPTTADALVLMGIRIPSDMTIYTAAPSSIPQPAPLAIQPISKTLLFQKLSEYEGN